MDDPQTPGEKEAYLKEHANLAWNVGTIIEDRMDGEGRADGRLWDFIYENLDEVYERVGPLLDDFEDRIFGTEEER